LGLPDLVGSGADRTETAHAVLLLLSFGAGEGTNRGRFGPCHGADLSLRNVRHGPISLLGRVLVDQGDPGSSREGALPAAGYQDVIDLAAVVRVDLFQVGPAAVAVDDRPGHAV
jgi:hypothetical protein